MDVACDLRDAGVCGPTETGVGAELELDYLPDGHIGDEYVRIWDGDGLAGVACGHGSFDPVSGGVVFAEFGVHCGQDMAGKAFGCKGRSEGKRENRAEAEGEIEASSKTDIGIQL